MHSTGGRWRCPRARGSGAVAAAGRLLRAARHRGLVPPSRAAAPAPGMTAHVPSIQQSLCQSSTFLAHTGTHSNHVSLAGGVKLMGSEARSVGGLEGVSKQLCALSCSAPHFANTRSATLTSPLLAASAVLPKQHLTGKGHVYLHRTSERIACPPLR
jgi:hypothetical protein